MKNIQLGFIALFRQFLDWEWFTDINTCHLFVYCLLRANHTDKAWRGIKIQKGQFITSFRTMSQETGLSIQEVRTALNKLLSTQELTHEPHRQNSIITVNNYSIYQNINTRFNKRATPDNNKIIDSNTSYIIVSLSLEERELLEKYLLKQKRKTPIEDIDAYISVLSKNGDLANKLEKAKKWNERQQAKKQEEQKKEKEKSEIPIITEEDEQKAREIIEQSMKKHGIKRRSGGANVTTQQSMAAPA